METGILFLNEVIFKHFQCMLLRVFLPFIWRVSNSGHPLPVDLTIRNSIRGSVYWSQCILYSEVPLYPYSLSFRLDATCTCNMQSFNCLFTQKFLLVLCCRQTLSFLLSFTHPSIYWSRKSSLSH